jgi:hypothetical protein
MKDQIPEAIGMAIFIVLGVLALVVALVWIAFPFIVNSHAKKITALLESINSKLQVQQSVKQKESREVIAQCKCPNCGQKIEFPYGRQGESAPCPSCHNYVLLTAQ